MTMELRVGDILTMKKPHPCGSEQWLVLDVAAQVRLRCLKCGHELTLPRPKAEKSIKTVRHADNPST